MCLLCPLTNWHSSAQYMLHVTSARPALPRLWLGPRFNPTLTASPTTWGKLLGIKNLPMTATMMWSPVRSSLNFQGPL